MPGPDVEILVPDTKPALYQIPSNVKSISTSQTSIEGTGTKMSEKVFDVAEEAKNAKRDEVVKDIKNAYKTSSSEIGTGR